MEASYSMKNGNITLNMNEMILAIEHYLNETNFKRPVKVVDVRESEDLGDVFIVELEEKDIRND